MAWGLILFVPILNSLLEKHLSSSLTRYGFILIASSLVASLISAPITAYYFGQTSLITVISNLIIVPLVSAGVIALITLLILELLWPAAATIWGLFTDRLLSLTSDLVFRFGRYEAAAVETPSFPAVYVFMILAGVAISFWALKSLRARRILVFYSLAAAAVFLGRETLWPEHLPDIEAFNRGSAQVLLVNRQGGMVIYRCQAGARFDEFNQNLVPYLTRRPSGPPTFYLFLEPTYQTRRRIDVCSDKYPRWCWTELNPRQESAGLSLWRLNIKSRNADDGGRIRLDNGALILKTEKAERLIFIFDPLRYEYQTDRYPPEKTAYYAVADDDKGLEEIRNLLPSSRLGIFLARPWNSFKTLKVGGSVYEGERNLETLIEIGETARSAFGAIK